ncbi:MAG: hypothetical protein PHW46_05310 [Candidatus Omnitrophica bacterium]|nr:hypothetical protein [Candidatus Omnitrophota bacterium]
MEIKNLEKIHQKARNITRLYVNDIIKFSGDNVVSVLAHGSVTSCEYNPKYSDINLAIILKDMSIPELKKMLKVIKIGMRHGVPAPLFLTKAYIEKSMDTFPMEFMTMKDSGCVLAGEDVFTGLEAKHEDLRKECEYQIKGKLLTLRQAYLENARDRRGMERLIKVSFKALLPVFQNMLRLKMKTPPAHKEEILSQMVEAFGVEMTSFLEILKDKKFDGRIGNKNAELFVMDFITQLERLSDVIDKL